MTPRTETELLAQTIELAMLNGWRVQHVRPARTDKGWRTPIQGHPADFEPLIVPTLTGAVR